jgi:charged multivesicular body protein 2A
VAQYYVMSSQLKAISMKLSTAEINQSMVDALKGVNTVMEKVNASMDIHSIQQVLKEFAKQSEKMEMQQEMVSTHSVYRLQYHLLLIMNLT